MFLQFLNFLHGRRNENISWLMEADRIKQEILNNQSPFYV